MSVHTPDHQYHQHPAQQSSHPYSNGYYKQEPHHPSDSHNSSPSMYPYGQHPQYQQQQQQHPQQQPQYPQQHQYQQQQQQQQPQQQHQHQHQQQHQQQQHHQHPPYPGMQASVQQPRMPPPNPSGMLPPLQDNIMRAPSLPALAGAQSMPSMVPQMQQQQMYGAPQPGVAIQVKPEHKAMAFSGINGEYRYELRVEQQPQRARMCGFGDKDRRPITPPPCVRLIITHKGTGQEIDPGNIEGSFFILQVDLWDKDATREVNIVRASSSSPAVSISTATTTSYPPPAERSVYNQFGQPMPITYAPQDAGQPFYDPSQGMGYAQSMYMPQFQQPVVPPHNNAQYTRNLIGSLTVNASLLNDTDGKPGYWFVLQDLSVRTEGWFRLKMNFIDVGDPTASAGLNRAKCPVLAWTYSEPFQVYSAKKFPGVIESTPLSKTFAHQGIKIPIRKEGKPEKNDDDED